MSQYTLSYCENCIQMTNHIGKNCQKCKPREYILLDDVKKIINSSLNWEESCEEILKLQTISPEEIIEKEIKHTLTKPEDPRTDAQVSVLEELLQKFK